MESRANNVLIAMMMLAVIMLVWNRATNAALQLVEQTYEIDSTSIERWPLAGDGNLIIRPCEGCDSVILKVDADTRYLTSFGGTAISLEELLELKTQIRGRSGVDAFVFYRADDSTVTRLVLDVD
ncbi:MAG: hypothetical protein HKN81_04095 [Gammaproteobacteria bacterium]|nr:hypothetical protein [Gammaproteobacteria bacterium]